MKVQVHRKLVRELNDLCLVQDLAAHSGAIPTEGLLQIMKCGHAQISPMG